MARRSKKLQNTSRQNQKQLRINKKAVGLGKLSNKNFIDNTPGDGILGVGLLRERTSPVSGFDETQTDRKENPIKTSKNVSKYLYFLVKSRNQSIRGDTNPQYYFYVAEMKRKVSMSNFAKQIGADEKDITPLTEDQYNSYIFEHPVYIAQDYSGVDISAGEVKKYVQITPGRMDDAAIGFPAFNYRSSTVVTKNEIYTSKPYTGFYASGAQLTDTSYNIPAGGTVQFIDATPFNPKVRPTSWSWVFSGEGVSPTGSTGRYPVVDYSNVPQGYYDVQLTATNSSGSTTLTKTDYVYWASDQDAQNLFDAVEGTDDAGTYLSDSQKSATVKLITSLKNKNMYDKVIFWPMLGNVAAGASYELGLRYNISWNSGVNNTHFNKYGFVADGTSDCWGNTGLIPNNVCASINDCGIGGYFIPEIATSNSQTPIGCNNASTGYFRISYTYPTFTGANLGSSSATGRVIWGSSAGEKFGLHTANRNSSTSLKLWRDSVNEASATTPDGVLSTYPVYIGAELEATNGVFRNFDGLIACGYVLTDNFTDVEIAEFETIVKTWILEMERWVEPKTYDYFSVFTSQNDYKFMEDVSLAYIDAGMTDTIYAKVKSFVPLYPGNYDDAVLDVTAQYNGTWVNSPPLYAYGTKGNAIDYAINTNFKANDEVGGNQIGMGIYLRVPPTASNYNQFLMGAISASAGDTLRFRFRNSNGIRAVYGNTGQLVEWETDGIEDQRYGMLIVNKDDSNNVQIIRNGETKITGSSTSSNDGNGTIFVLAANNDGTDVPTTPLHEDYPVSGYFLTYLTTEAEVKVVGDWMEAIMRRRGISVVDANYSLPSEAETYFNNLENDSVYIGSQEAKAKIDTIQDLVSSGIWDLIDFIQVYATIEQSDNNLLIDWKGGTGFSLTPGVYNSLTKTIDGITGNGIDMYLLSGYSPATDRTNTSIYNRAIYLKVIDPGASGGVLCGARGGSSSSNTNITYSTGPFNTNIGIHGTSRIDLVSVEPTGLLSGERQAEDRLASYVNDVAYEYDFNTVTGTMTNSNMGILANNNNGTAQAHGDATIALYIETPIGINKVKLTSIVNKYLLRLKGHSV